MATEAVLTKTQTSPEVRGGIVAGMFAFAVIGNLLAMLHKFSRGTASNTTYAGRGAQMAALVGTVAGAAVRGKNQNGNGQLGLLFTLLPAAVKSYAYLSRDIFNLMLPLESNHDEDYTKPVTSQLADSPGYFANQETVNVAQGAAQLSGAGFTASSITRSRFAKGSRICPVTCSPTLPAKAWPRSAGESPRKLRSTA